MSSPSPSPPPSRPKPDLTHSTATIPSDSENYSSSPTRNLSPSPELSSPKRQRGQPIILYTPPTIWGLLRGAAINVLLPFVNGLMLGFGELFANEIAFRFGWSGTKIFPGGRASRPMGPGVEIQNHPSKRWRGEKDEYDLDTTTALE